MIIIKFSLSLHKQKLNHYFSKQLCYNPLCCNRTDETRFYDKSFEYKMTQFDKIKNSINNIISGKNRRRSRW